jgi:integrase
MINEVQVKMRNPFKSVNFNTVVYDTSSITKEEFLGVLSAVKNKSQYEQLGGLRKEVKNRYKPYLINGFKLALFTGLRREELVTLSWNDLYYSNKLQCLTFTVDNLKVERITGKKFKSKYIPVGPDLMELLEELGYNERKGSDKYVLKPNRKVKHTTIMVALSKGFSHYYKQAFPEETSRKFKVLRKTYLSYLNKTVGDDMVELSSHGGMKTLKAHYIDAEVIAKGLTMNIFD